MKSPKWTKAQTLAIEATGRDVLVTASAGAGKTAVLTQRCIRIISDAKKPVDIDQLLVLTFTDAAAEEMKSRIAEKLYAICVDEPANRHLRKQLVRLDAAWIGTIHSFCKRVLTEHFYLAGLDPRFGILDPDQQKLIRAEAMTEAIETAWRNPAMADAMKTLFDGRPLRGRGNTFPDTMLRLTEFLDSVPDRNAFYQSASPLAGDNPRARDTLTQLYCDYLARQLSLYRDMAGCAQRLDQSVAGGQYLSAYIADIIQTIDHCLGAVQRKDLAATANLIMQWDFPKLPAVGKKLQLDKEQTDKIKELVDDTRKKIKSLKNLILFRPDLSRQILPAADSQTQTLIALLREFDSRFRAAKQALGVLDFADLEHQTLAMFNTHPEVAEKLRQRFGYVFVDEYQDINDIQQRLLQAVSRPDNVFVVGDVKQSIYSFRQSRPEIFLGQLAAATEDPKSSSHALRVDMNDNFRSRRQILAFVNDVFGRLMTQSLAGMDYTGRAELIAGLEYPPLSGKTQASRRAVELYLLDENTDEESGQDNNEDQQEEYPPSETMTENSITAVQRQAAFIARRIRQMVEDAEFEVMDKSTQQMRPVQYRDIVVLMRALSYRAAEYVELLRLAGIPVSSQSQCGYFAAIEITDFLSLLKVLDNPLQDIELAAVLRSALFRFSDSDLALMRCFAGQAKEKCSTFYDAVNYYASHGDRKELCQKAADALSAIGTWRTQSRRRPLSEIIWQIYQDYGLLAFVSALPNGPQRRANLLKLHDRAVQFESFAGVSAGRNLAAFVDFLEKLHEEEFDWAPAQPDTGSENAVRVMSVHKSKGLEFPVVFLAELNRSFHKSQNHSSCQINAQMLALELPDLHHGVKVPTPACQLIRQTQKQADIAEEMRILYVAMTRARDRLVLTATEKSDRCRNRLVSIPDTKTLPDWVLINAQSHLDWILAALAKSDTVKQIIAADSQNFFEDDLFIGSCVGKEQLDKLTESIRSQKRRREKTWEPVKAGCSDIAAKNLFEQIQNSLQWDYPSKALTTLNAKFSVSALTHRDDESARFMDFSIPDQDSFAVSRPDALHIGSAVHLIFQHLSLDTPVNEAVIQQTIEELSRQKRITPHTAGQVDVSAIASFFQTDIGRQVLAQPDKVMREWPFTIALPVSQMDITISNEFVVVQGIADMIIPAENGIILVDFKTDKIGAGAIDKRVMVYQTQLALYARAVQTILDKPVTAAYLYFLHPRILHAVEIDNIKLKPLCL